jgi:hypothetical protein
MGLTFFVKYSRESLRVDFRNGLIEIDGKSSLLTTSFLLVPTIIHPAEEYHSDSLDNSVNTFGKSESSMYSSNLHLSS